MGIEISIFEGKVPLFPRDIELTLVCDGCITAGSLFGFGHAIFTNREAGFIGCYRDAMRAGWKESHVTSERRFLGPCCSGKI